VPSPLPGSTSYDADVAQQGNRILDDNRSFSGALYDVQGVANDLYAAQQQTPEKADALRAYVEAHMLPLDTARLPQALDLAHVKANAQPVDTTHPVSVNTKPGESPRTVLDRAYREMATRAGLSPEAIAEFVQRAPALDGGQLHGPSNDPFTTGPVITPTGGSIDIAPTAAQAGLLKLLAAQDASGGNGLPPPSGAPVGIPFTPQSGGKPGNVAVTPEIAAEILRNVSEGLPPFKPELGQVGGVSWFVTDGDPYTGTGPEKSVTLPAEIANTSGKPVLQFGEAELLEIYNSKYADAHATVEAQVREASGKTNGEPLSNRNLRDIERRTNQLAERQMWTEVGERVGRSESGVGRVTLQNSKFSRGGDGEFTATSKAENIRIKGGAQALLDIIKTQGVPVEPEVLEAAKATAAREGWTGTVQGAFRVGGKVLIVVGVAVDGYRIYTAEDKVKTITEVAGGWAGAAAAGGAFAAYFAPADVAGPWAWLAHGVGTLGAGALGYWAGSEISRTVYELVVEGDPIEIR
jgi:hypothetical protein